MFDFRTIPALFLFLLTTACSGQVNSKSTEIIPLEETSSVELFFKNQPPIVNPTKIAIALDYTRSRETSRIGQITLDDLSTLMNKISSQGGEIGVIAICSDSNLPALRIRIESPPYLDPKDVDFITKPVPPNLEGISPFKAAELKKDYQKQLAQYQQFEAKALQEIALHKQDLEQWKDLQNQKLNSFKSELKTLLAQPANCQNTDIWGAIARIDLFLNEDTSTWKLTPNNFAVLITDGEHNSDREPVAMQSEAEIILVNGAGKGKEIEKYLNYKAFEAPSAAFNHITHKLKEVKNEK